MAKGIPFFHVKNAFGHLVLPLPLNDHAYFRMMARRFTTLDAVAMLPASGPFRWTASKKNSVLSSKTGTSIIKLSLKTHF